MIRTALRFSTVAALQAGGTAPYPTIAGPEVFDSRRAPIEDIVPERGLPTILVRTLGDSRPYVVNGMAWPNASPARTMELQIEYGIAIAAMQTAEDGTVQRVTGWPEVDTQLEAQLDIFDYQVAAALFGFAPWALWWAGLWPKINVESRPVYEDADVGNVQLAARIMTVTCQVPDERYPKPVRSGDALNPGEHPRLTEVLSYIDANGGGDLKIASQQLRAMLDQFPLPDGGAYPALLAVGAAIDGIALPGPETVQPSVLNAELYDPPEE
jgi:hypothetical protein